MQLDSRLRSLSLIHAIKMVEAPLRGGDGLDRACETEILRGDSDRLCEKTPPVANEEESLTHILESNTQLCVVK